MGVEGSRRRERGGTAVSVWVGKLAKARLCLKTAREYGAKTHAFKHF